MGSNGLLLSAIIPVSRMSGKFGNLSMWLKEASKFPIKIIFVHDVQDDLTGVELKNLVSGIDLESILILEGRFGNPGEARNFGIKSIEGRWFTFWDSDDLPNLENIFLCLERFPTAEILIGSFETENESGEVKAFKIEENLVDHLLRNPGIWRIVFKAELQEKIVFPNLRMAEDQIAISNIGIFNFKLKVCDTIFYRYFTNFPGQLTSNKEALNDLFNAVKVSKLNLKNHSRMNSSFAYGLYAKQLLTGLKSGSIKLKLKMIIHITCSIFPFNVFYLRKMTRAFIWNFRVWMSYEKK
jgi:glycosyltransferase involved in cell wall biosynthesis